MKRLTSAAVVLLITWLTFLPAAAQDSKASNFNDQVGKNPVSYAVVQAFSDGRGVWLEWKTDFEAQNLGFYIYRIVGGEKQLVNSTFVPGAYLQAREEKITAGNYSFFDRFGDVNSVYIIESYHVNGRRHDSHLIQTEFVSDLTPIAGASSAQLEEQAKNAKPQVIGSESILPPDLAAEVKDNRAAADPITQRWVAAQPGVKIAVKTEGFYRVSRANLQSNGFEVNAPSERWQLYANGVEQAIIVGENDGYIEFYGKGIDTPEADVQIYFLVVGAENGKRIRSAARARVSSSILSSGYAQSFYKKEHTFYNQDILNGDAENTHGTPFDNVFTANISFNLSSIDFSSPNASVVLTLQGLTPTAHLTKVVLNEVQIGTVNGGSGYDSTVKRLDFPTSVLRDGENTLQLTSLVTGANDSSAFSSIYVNFVRRYRADRERLAFHVPNYKASYAEGFASPNIRVFDTTDPDAPVLINNLIAEPSGGGYRVYLPSNRGRVMYAVTDAGLSAATSITQNFPSTLSTANNDGKLIIIAHKNFMTQAEDWANYRRGQGVTVKVVNVEDVFDEFNFGVLKADAVKDFLNYAKNFWQDSPKYVLLIGDATFDPKNYFGLNANFVPTRMVDTVYMETGSDEALADFNNDGLAEIAVGRIPARTAAVVTQLLNKTIAFEQTVAQEGSSRGVIFASDLPDNYFNFEAMSNTLCSRLPGNVPCIKINRGQPNAAALLLTELNTGRFIANYAGHGNFSVWATNGFFGSTQAAQLTNINRLTLFTMLTCLNGYFIHPTDSLSEVLLKNQNGGAVSVWASTGLTAPNTQETMASRFYSQVAAGNLTRIGDLIRDAKTTIPDDRDVRLSWALLGDPMMKVK